MSTSGKCLISPPTVIFILSKFMAQKILAAPHELDTRNLDMQRGITLISLFAHSRNRKGHLDEML